MKTSLLACLALALTSACASTEGNGDSSSPRKADAKVAKAAISSVQMIEDCPGDDPAPAAAEPPAQGAAAKAPARMAAEAEDVAPGDYDESMVQEDAGNFEIEQPCTQSTMQLSFTGQGPSPAKVEIQAVRILSPAGKPVASIKARAPKAWKDGGYKPWDEMLAPNADLKASYKLSVPDWSDLDKKLGGKGSYGTMLKLEVDVVIGGQKQTVRSSDFSREEPHVIVT